MQTIETDYLVVGAGAMGMAFADTLVAETDATVVIVDRNDQPGGHWLSAYPYVRLHQPSAFYGVNSRTLGTDSIDTSGWNEGFFELAGGSEVVAYYDTVMRQHLLPSGRVTFLPMSEYLGTDDAGAGLIRTYGGDDVRVDVRRRIVDATYLSVIVPSMRPPTYRVGDGVTCIPPNGLARRGPHGQYVLVGAGKTAMDTGIWLLRHGIGPERITWIKPRESWLLDRAVIQPSTQFARRALADFAAQLRAINNATTVDDLLLNLEASGSLLRVDRTVEPTMYRCATVSHPELEMLRTITDSVRLGHVESIEPGRITLTGGTFDTHEDALFVDCSGDGTGHQEPVPVFSPGAIVLQSVRTCQPTFSAAMIAHVETMDVDDDTRNRYARPIPHPTMPVEWASMTLAYNENQLGWAANPELSAWLNRSRLNAESHLEASDAEAAAGFAQIAPRLRAANEKLAALLG